MTDTWDRMTRQQTDLAVELLRTAHEKRHIAVKADEEATAAIKRRDLAAAEATVARDAIVGVLHGAGVPIDDARGWEIEACRDHSIGRNHAGNSLYHEMFGTTRPALSRYVIIGVIHLSGDTMGKFTGIDTWTAIGTERPEVDGIHYRYLYERQEF